MADPTSATPIRPTPRQTSTATTTDSSAIYFEISPNIIFAVRALNLIVLLMVGIAFILTLIQAQNNETYYLLACNIVISSFVGIVVNYWYRSGDLGVEKYWYIILVAVVILLQTITTDIIVYRTPPEDAISISTAKPIVNISTVSWVTISNTTNRSLLFPYTTTPHPVPMELDVY